MGEAQGGDNFLSPKRCIMEARNSVDTTSSKEKHGVFSYSINGILGLKSGSDSIKGQDGEKAGEVIKKEGNN